MLVAPGFFSVILPSMPQIARHGLDKQASVPQRFLRQQHHDSMPRGRMI